MIIQKLKPVTIEEYINIAPAENRETLRKLHACILTAAPGVHEDLKWGMPAYSYERILVTFALFKHHIGFYTTPSVVQAFAEKIAKYKTAKGSIQLPLDQPLPLSLISKMTKFRVRESLEKDIKWKS